jgi:hypothetical protein
MAKLFATRGAQPLLLSEFVANYNDTMTSVSGVLSTFGSVYTDALTFDIINLPPTAIISHGEVIVDAAYTGTTAATVSIGDSGSATRYLASTTIMSVTAGTKYPFTMNVATGTNSAVSAIGGYTGTNIRLTMTHTVANATAGKFRVRVYWSLEGKINETYPQ